MPAKKYKLFSAEAPDGEKLPCAFFASAAGCRNGDNCKFSHEIAGKSSPPAADASSVVSSESEDEPKKVVQQKAKKAVVKEEVRQKDEDESPFVKSPSELKAKSRRRQNDETRDPFAKAKKKAKTTPEKTPPAPAPVPSPTPAAKPQKQAVKQPSYLDLDLPVASFAMPGATPVDQPLLNNNSGHNSEDVDDALPLPNSTPDGRKWLQAVIDGRKHPRYETAFDYTKYKNQDRENGLTDKWVKAKRFGSWCADAPQVISIDCEMCETADPVTGKHDPRALCRISVVDCKTDKALLDSLVKPTWPVVDYRSRINGITADHLASVQFTLEHAQAFMMALCSRETVIVGHAVHNDMAAIRMEHNCVADSALLFKASDSETASVSLKDLAKAVLGKEMPNKHDSVNDAITAQKCIEHYLEKKGKVKEVVRSSVVQREAAASQLFIHRIPKGVCSEENLTKMFLVHTSVQPSAMDSIEFTGDHGKTHVTFPSSRHANLAFDSLDSKAEEEASGRLQKKVFLRNGGYIRVRKMVKEMPNKPAPKPSTPVSN